MRKTLAAVLLSILVATPATAAPCATQGASSARELTLNLKDPKVLEGLAVSFRFGLLPPEFPENDIATAKDPCTRGTFPFTNGMTMELRGEDSDSPPRWAVSPIAGPTVFVAMMPKPKPALKAAAEAAKTGSVSFRPGDMMYAVVLTLGDTHRHIFHFFDQIPDDARLKALFHPIVISQGREQVTYDVKTGRLEVR